MRGAAPCAAGRPSPRRPERSGLRIRSGPPQAEGLPHVESSAQYGHGGGTKAWSNPSASGNAEAPGFSATEPESEPQFPSPTPH